MKKITFLLAVLTAFTMNAQLFSDDFDDEDISDWTNIDVDGDGNVFFAVTQTTGSYMSSRSWDATPLTPNNYVVSPAIDVTGASSITLNYMVGGQDPGYSQEVYTAYVSTGNTVEDFMDDAITVSFNEDLGDDAAAAGALVSRTLDASALVGATTVYIAFRHHDVSDQFIINFDDVVLDGVLSAEDNVISGFTQYVDANNNLKLSIDNGSLESVSLFNALGQNVLSSKIANTNATIALNSLSAGVYIAKVSVNGQTTTFRIIRK